MYKVIQFNQKAWHNSYNDMNTKLRREARNDFSKLMNNAVFENCGKCKKTQRY